MRPLRRLLVLAGLAALAAGAALAASPAPTLHVQVFNDTGIKLTGIVWTGKRFLYVENTTNALFAGDAKGGPLEPFAQLPKLVEETRCAVSPGGHGFPAGQIYCHVPDNRIFRISPDGKTVRLFASLPTTETSDGMLAFDTVGGFGYRLVASTGRSGSASATGGTLYTIDPAGTVQEVGSYAGPGGADGLAIAPAGFGSIAGWALLTVDAGSAGTVVAVDPHGQTRTIARLPDGPNPIAVVQSGGGAAPAAAAGLYVADTATQKVYFVSASQLAAYAGDVVVGTEIKARFWYIRPRGRGFLTRELKTDLPAGTYNLEGAEYVP
jgi:sugar lactone lactonase YvrE